MSFDALTLNCFIAVADTGSFTKASQRINRTQSAVSQQIAKLENIIGRPLFVRGKNLSLTSDGEIFYPYATQISTLYRQALERFKQPDLEGQVRFGLPEDFATIFLTDVLVDFAHIHPGILLNIECDLTLNLFDRFRQNEFDMVLIKMSKPEDFPNGVEVWSEKLEWVANKNFFTSFDDKRPLPLVLSPQPCLYRARAINGLEDNMIKWQLVFSSTSYSTKIAAVQAGLGVTVLPQSMIPKQLSIIDNTILPPLSDTHVSLLKHNKNNPAVVSFEDFILKKLHV
ncbi:MAG: LysR family transcriptional regulator [Alphaproteobacteria bacterium]